MRVPHIYFSLADLMFRNATCLIENAESPLIVDVICARLCAIELGTRLAPHFGQKQLAARRIEQVPIRPNPEHVYARKYRYIRRLHEQEVVDHSDMLTVSTIQYYPAIPPAHMSCENRRNCIYGNHFFGYIHGLCCPNTCQSRFGRFRSYACERSAHLHRPRL